MCEKLLTETLDGRIPINSLLKFLSNGVLEDQLLVQECSHIEFVSYFLNYIHEIQHINKKFLTSTPTKATPQCNDNITPKVYKKRATLSNNTPSSAHNRSINDSYHSPVSPLYNNSNRSGSKLTFGDYISGKKKFTRRINPTSLNFNSNTVEFTNNSFNFNGISDNTDGQRNVLVEECLKITCKNPPVDLPLKSLSICSNKLEVVPCLEKITFKDRLDKLILIYNCIVSNYYILNYISELHFLITVLLTKEYVYEEDSLFPFRSLHNRVYFTANVLCNFNNVIGLLDKVTLRLIIENKRIQNFVTLKPTELKCEVENTEDDVCNENVCYILDTDNRTNFPSDTSFHAFRKQRDLFYDILRIWENNHLHDDWNFGIALGGKIRALLNMHVERTNLVHLARLFKAQLLTHTCGKNNDDLSFVSSISNTNAEKLQRLKDRIFTKHPSNGIHAIPTFTGYEEFYRDFILVGAHHAFNKHLNDALITNIMELNETKFDCIGLDDAEAIIDQATKKSYVVCLKSLRILAKFLGFLDALPYGSQVQNIPTCCMEIRSRTQPNIDLLTIVDKMYTSGNLILTIPWLTNYLAMLDYTSLRLPYFGTILYKLFEIYCSNCEIPIHNLLFIKINLGWLFELPQFPENLYYDWLKKDTSTDTVRSSTLDALSIIDHTLIYMCCPYLNEIKQLLSNDAVNIINTVKHITPLTSVYSTHKRVQLQLEEAFFNGQPVSVRKTVEFVSERIASACVKHVCNEMVPNFRREALSEFKSVEGEPDVEKIASDQLKKIRGLIDDSVRTMIGNRVDIAIGVLLAADVLDQTRNVCIKITTHTCLERVQQWVNSHVNADLFIKDFNAHLKKQLEDKPNKPIFLLPTFGKDIECDENALSGKDCLEAIRSLSCTLLEDPNAVTIQAVEDLVNSVLFSIHRRCDLNELTIVLSCKMLVDFVILLLTHQPDVLNQAIEQCLFDIWRRCQEDIFETFISLRNVCILTKSSNITFTRQCFCRFVKRLIQKQFVTDYSIKMQAGAISRHDLNKDMSQFLCDSLKCIASDN